MALSKIQTTEMLDAPNLGRRNLIINGAMQVAQRGTQTGQTSSGYTACDRFLTAEGGAAVSTSSQSTDVPSGQGFANSLKIDITTADTDISTNDFFLLIHRLEGQDLQRLCYGTSSAKDLTISFWIKSPKTGTHILELRHQDATYYNGQVYTIASANTWQKVTLTYSGYTTTAFDNDNNHSLSLHWWLAAGSNFSSGTLQSNTWQNTETNRAAGQVNCVDSASNEIYITGVQMEVSSVATEFEHRSFGEELSLCQRYYQVGDVYRGINNDQEISFDFQHRVPMRIGTGTRTYTKTLGSVTDSLTYAANVSSENNTGYYRTESNVWGYINVKVDAEL